MGGFVWVFPDFGKMQVPPLGGGVSAFLGGCVGGWVAELGRPPVSFMGRGTLCHMGVLQFCSDLFWFKLFFFTSVCA